MLTAIIVDDTGYLASITEKLTILRGLSSVGDIFVASSDRCPQQTEGCEWIEAESLVDSLIAIAKRAASKRIIIVSASVTFADSELSAFCTEADRTPMIEHLIAAPRTDGSVADLPDLSPNSIIEAITRYDTWPLMCVATTRSQLTIAESSEGATVTEMIGRMLIRAIADGDSVRTLSSGCGSTSASMIRASCELDDLSRARLLSTAVDAINVEELFPNHAWSQFSQESAAAAYHALAALFLRFGDTSSASDCLGCSERLEESPRYFALRGLIQHRNGETLGAVANMVSSLQCYEARKSTDGKHYLSFAPRNLEIVNSRLVDGLNALNKRENDRALTHFSEAVFNFDPFYADFGVQSLEKIRM